MKIFKSEASAESFLKTAKVDKKQAEKVVLDWIISERRHLSGSTIQTFLAAVRSLHDFAEINPPMNWEKIAKAVTHNAHSKPTICKSSKGISGSDS